MSETVELADGREVPSACTQALDNFDETIWPGATFPTARAAIAAAVIEAAEPYLRKKWAEELVERIGASNLGAPLRIFPDGTAHIASGPEMRALLCEFILEGAGE